MLTWTAPSLYPPAQPRLSSLSSLRVPEAATAPQRTTMVQQFADYRELAIEIAGVEDVVEELD